MKYNRQNKGCSYSTRISNPSTIFELILLCCINGSVGPYIMTIVRTSIFGPSTYYSMYYGTVVHTIVSTLAIVHFIVHVL